MAGNAMSDYLEWLPAREWRSLDDRVAEYLEQHPECDEQDAFEAVIWDFEMRNVDAMEARHVR